MRYQDLAVSTQILLVGLLALVLAAVVALAAIFFSRTFARVPQRYPRTWAEAQCWLLERVRLTVGVVLSLLWAALLVAIPHMPTNAPFGFLEVVLIVMLLLLSYAWIVLLLPRDWEALGVLTRHFSITITVLALWWSVMLGGTVWTLAKASAPRAPYAIAGPVVAVLELDKHR
jgi:hypothetical protein